MPTSTAFEATILGLYPNAGSRARAQMAGAAYKLRQRYTEGYADPLGHTLAKSNPAHVAALNADNQMVAFDAITTP